MAKETKADKAIRDAADEVKRETRAAAAEVRIELGAAKRETSAALREVMGEVRAALSEIWEPEEASGASSGGRMSRAQRKEMTRELLLDAGIEVFATATNRCCSRGWGSAGSICPGASRRARCATGGGAGVEEIDESGDRFLHGVAGRIDHLDGGGKGPGLDRIIVLAVGSGSHPGGRRFVTPFVAVAVL